MTWAQDSLTSCPLYLIEKAGVFTSIDFRNSINAARSRESFKVSVPPVPAERCATFSRTLSRESAEPSCR